MSFISVKNLATFGRPRLTARRNGTCHVTKPVTEGFNTIDVEMDLENKIIRVKSGVGLSKNLGGAVKSTFTIPVAAYSLMIPDGQNKVIIYLEKNKDGWWYGNYCNSIKGDKE